MYVFAGYMQIILLEEQLGVFNMAQLRIKVNSEGIAVQHIAVFIQLDISPGLGVFCYQIDLDIIGFQQSAALFNLNPALGNHILAAFIITQFNGFDVSRKLFIIGFFRAEELCRGMRTAAVKK